MSKANKNTKTERRGEGQGRQKIKLFTSANFLFFPHAAYDQIFVGCIFLFFRKPYEKAPAKLKTDLKQESKCREESSYTSYNIPCATFIPRWQEATIIRSIGMTSRRA